MRLRPIKANKTLDVLMFIQGFCDTLEEAKLATHYKTAGANYKQFSIEQSRSQPHKIRISFFALPSKEFLLRLNLKDLNSDPEGYLERTMDMVNDAVNKMRSGNYEVLL